MENFSRHGEGARVRRRQSARRTKNRFRLVSFARNTFVRTVIVEVLKDLIAETVKYLF